MATAYTPPGDPTDIVGRRFAAFLIDAVLLGSIGFFVFAVLRSRSYSKVPADACKVLKRAGGNPLCLKLGSHVFLWHSSALRITVLVVLLAALVDGVVLQSLTGASVGKLCMRLSVVDEHGQIAKPLRVFGRWVFLVVDLGFCLVGCISILVTHPHRRLGDFVFGTYVISLRSVGRPIGGEMALTASAKGAPSTNGSPENWTAPPAPSPAKTPLAAPLPTMPPPVRTPPGTAPTAPGEWGAVARPVPLVRSPQWATPPESETAVSPTSSDPTVVPKWAAPPGPQKAEASPESDDADDDVSAADEAAAEPEPVEAVLGDTETAGPEAEAEAEAEAEEEPEAAEEAGAAPEVETTAAKESPDDGTSDDDASPPELSEWSPVVASAKRRRSRAGSDGEATGAEESWWDEALSSGDAEDAPDGAS